MSPCHLFPLCQLSKLLPSQTPEKVPAHQQAPPGAHLASFLRASIPSFQGRPRILQGHGFFLHFLKPGSPQGWKYQPSVLCLGVRVTGSKAMGNTDRKVAVAASGFLFIFLIMCSGVSLHTGMCIRVLILAGSEFRGQIPWS